MTIAKTNFGCRVLQSCQPILTVLPIKSFETGYKFYVWACRVLPFKQLGWQKAFLGISYSIINKITGTDTLIIITISDLEQVFITVCYKSLK